MTVSTAWTISSARQPLVSQVCAWYAVPTAFGSSRSSFCSRRSVSASWWASVVIRDFDPSDARASSAVDSDGST
jgi:hypothetical protein